MRTILLGLALVGCSSNDFSVTKQDSVLTVTPSILDFGTLSPGETASATITLAHVEGNEDIRLLDASILAISGEGFAIDASSVESIARGEIVELPVTWAPSAGGFQRAQLSITTTEVDSPRHDVLLRGAAALPSPTVWPGLLDLGPVAAGARASALVHVRNDGGVPLVIAGATLSNTQFTVTELAGTSIEPGDTLEIAVDLVAADSSAVRGDLAFDFGSAGSARVSLQANDCAGGDPALYDEDGDGMTACAGDCLDSDIYVRPGVEERCDALDNDCDGAIDEDTTCSDDDGDGRTEDAGDCDDTDPAVVPGAVEDPMNGRDDDCDGTVDLGLQDLDGDGAGVLGGDCDDGRADVAPGATEVADGVDNDCDGIVDEGTEAYDDDGDGASETVGDCDDTDSAILPGVAEAPNGADDDCDGLVDEGTIASDDDGDGFTERGGDCDDADPARHPAAREVAGDALDNNCDGVSP